MEGRVQARRVRRAGQVLSRRRIGLEPGATWSPGNWSQKPRKAAFGRAVGARKPQSGLLPGIHRQNLLRAPRLGPIAGAHCRDQELISMRTILPHNSPVSLGILRGSSFVPLALLLAVALGGTQMGGAQVSRTQMGGAQALAAPASAAAHQPASTHKPVHARKRHAAVKAPQVKAQGKTQATAAPAAPAPAAPPAPELPKWPAKPRSHGTARVCASRLPTPAWSRF